MKNQFGILDSGMFDHLRYFLYATGSPFFLLFFPTKFLGLSSFWLVGLLGIVISFVIIVLTYYEWGKTSLPRHRLDQKDLLRGVVPCGALYFLFLIGGWVLMFIVKVHWHFSSVFLASLMFPPMSTVLAVFGIRQGYFADERVVPWYMTACFVLFAVVCCIGLMAAAVISYKKGVRDDEKEIELQEKGEFVKISFTKKVFFIPVLNLISLFSWLLRHMIHTEARLREIFLPFFVFAFSGVGYYFLTLLLSELFHSAFVYYALRVFGFYLAGLFFSFVEVIDEKKYSFLTF